MSLLVASGSFLGKATSGAFSVTGVGFQPKIVIVWGGANPTGLGNHADANWSLCAATSSSQRVTGAGRTQDNVGTSATLSTFSTGGFWREVYAGQDPIRGFTSMDADGFAINFTFGMSPQTRGFYLCLGGTDIINAKAGSFSSGTGTGNVSSTNPGFQPDLLLLFRGSSGLQPAAARGRQRPRCAHPVRAQGARPCRAARARRRAPRVEDASAEARAVGERRERSPPGRRPAEPADPECADGTRRAEGTEWRAGQDHYRGHLAPRIACRGPGQTGGSS